MRFQVTLKAKHDSGVWKLVRRGHICAANEAVAQREAVASWWPTELKDVPDIQPTTHVVRITTECQERILGALRLLSGPQHPATECEIAHLLHMSPYALRRPLHQLRAAGDVVPCTDEHNRLLGWKLA